TLSLPRAPPISCARPGSKWRSSIRLSKGGRISSTGCSRARSTSWSIPARAPSRSQTASACAGPPLPTTFPITRRLPVPALPSKPSTLSGPAVLKSPPYNPILKDRSERPMTTKIPMTSGGFDRLQEELKRLKTVDRPAIILAIAEAREQGDIAENAEYHSARERQCFIEGRVMELEDKIARAEVIDVSKLSGKVIKFGATVTLIDEDTDEKSAYQIVGEDEADIKSKRLAITAPLARALVGKKVGDSVEVTTPGGSKSYEVAKVQFK